MSWCDKLASTPTVGLRFATGHKSSDKILDALSPLLDSWVDDKHNVTIERQETFTVQLSTEEGFTYAVDPNRISVDFKHRWKIKPRSGGTPTAELTTAPRPFTEILPEVASKAIEVAGLINGSRPRTLLRIGIVATTTVAQSDAPPGVLRLLSFISKPWQTSLDFFDIHIAGDLGRTDDYSDRCLHLLKKSEDDNPDDLILIKLDWQRIFSTNKITSSDVLKKYVLSAQESALAYFEDVAEGSRFDEKLISIPA